jgi:hypothetical protein
MATDTIDRKLTEKEKQDLEKVLPMWKIVFNQFLEHRMAVVGLSVIIFFILVALLAPVIRMVTGLDPDAQNPLNRYKPPMSVIEMTADKKEDLILRFEASHPDTVAELRKAVITQGTVTPEVEEDALFDLIRLPREEVLAAL